MSVFDCNLGYMKAESKCRQIKSYIKNRVRRISIVVKYQTRFPLTVQPAIKTIDDLSAISTYTNVTLISKL